MIEPGFHDIDGSPRELVDGPMVSFADLKTMEDQSARVARIRQTDPKPPPTEPMNDGLGIHAILMEPDKLRAGGRYVVSSYPDYRKTAAKEERDAFVAEGKIVVKQAWLDWLQTVANQVRDHEGARAMLDGGRYEQTALCRDPQTGLWLCSKSDIINEPWVCDIKTTGDVSPDRLAWACVNGLWHIQGAFYLDIIAALGVFVSRCSILAVETAWPYQVAVYEIPGWALAWARLRIRDHLDTFARCFEDAVWPGYQDGTTPRMLEFPASVAYRMREEAGFDDEI